MPLGLRESPAREKLGVRRLTVASMETVERSAQSTSVCKYHSQPFIIYLQLFRMSHLYFNLRVVAVV